MSQQNQKKQKKKQTSIRNEQEN